VVVREAPPLMARRALALVLTGRRPWRRPALLGDWPLTINTVSPQSLFGPEAATPTGQFWTLADLKRAIQRWYGVVYDSPTSYYTLFERCGFSYQRPDQVFKSRRQADVLDWEDRAEKN
jgi:hypothetical protein